ncbi:MAG: hypothetical protein IT406_02070 [Candidatus Yanofskybacteria bacterium]|nr:hypothetical protein [Candidatus Yanofskybacteria bacterium]
MRIEEERQLNTFLCAEIVHACACAKQRKAIAHDEYVLRTPILRIGASIMRTIGRTWTTCQVKTGVGALPMPGRIDDLRDFLAAADDIAALKSLPAEKAIDLIAADLTTLADQQELPPDRIGRLIALFDAITRRVRRLPGPMCRVPLQRGSGLEDASD